MNTRNNSTCFRLVVKFKDYLIPAELDEPEINYFFSQRHRKLWRQLVELLPEVKIRTLFNTVSPSQVRRLMKKASQLNALYQPPDFFSYFSIDWTREINPEDVLRIFKKCKNLELAYLQYGSIFPPSVGKAESSNFYQTHLNPAPHGINAKYAWTIEGGDGAGKVAFIDVEQGWISNHESIFLNTLPDSGINCGMYSDHGVAVLGIIMMRENNSGGLGITPQVNGSIVSQWRPDRRLNTADAIMTAVQHLSFGDILLLEAQTSEIDAPASFWPVEMEDAVYHTIELATALGITVIEAAGNGKNRYEGNDLDLFESNGKKILKPNGIGYRDSGAILVAAATSTAPHFRKSNSNYGSRIDCYAAGENVFTAGNYPRSSRWATNLYTYSFNGTSSAAAIVAGAAISIQSIVETNFGRRLNPKEMRDLLGSAFYNTHSANGLEKDKIGVMPDLKKIITDAFRIKPATSNIEKIAQQEKEQVIKNHIQHYAN